MKRFSAFIRVNNKTRSLDDDYDTEDEAMQAALKYFWAHRRLIRIYSFTVPGEVDELSRDKPQSSKQVTFTGTGKRKVVVPSTASNQLRISNPDVLKDARQHQSAIELPVIAPTPKTYPTKAPSKRSVGRGQN